MLFIKSKVSFD